MATQHGRSSPVAQPMMLTVLRQRRDPCRGGWWRRAPSAHPRTAAYRAPVERRGHQHPGRPSPSCTSAGDRGYLALRGHYAPGWTAGRVPRSAASSRLRRRTGGSCSSSMGNRGQHPRPVAANHRVALPPLGFFGTAQDYKCAAARFRTRQGAGAAWLMPMLPQRTPWPRLRPRLLARASPPGPRAQRRSRAGRVGGGTSTRGHVQNNYVDFAPGLLGALAEMAAGCAARWPAALPRSATPLSPPISSSSAQRRGSPRRWSPRSPGSASDVLVQAGGMTC